MADLTAMMQAAAGNVGGDANFIEDVFSTYLYTGNDAALTVTNGIDLAGEGGLVWGKSRSGAQNHRLYDTARGSSFSLISNATSAQSNQGANACAFNTDGFSLSASSGIVGSATFGGPNYVSWTFRKQPKFFDVVTYTGNGVAGRTVAHNLGSVPGSVISKAYAGSTQNWLVYHRSLGANTTLILNSTDAAYTSSPEFPTTPTATEFYVGSFANVSGTTYVAYLFAHDAGGFGLTGEDNVISCGSFNPTSNGSVDLGYEPQWIIAKKATGTGGAWFMWDSMRGWPAGRAVSGQVLRANESIAEASTSGIAPTATGFEYAALGDTWIYIAIRRGPMKVPETGTSVFAPYTATLSAGTSVNAGLTPDLLFAKFRPGQDNPRWVDRLRGYANATGGSNPELYSNESSAETTSTAWSFNWNNTGYVIGNSLNGLNCILYALRRAPSTFDQVCYTGTGSAGVQIPHNLGVAPELLIVKPRNQDGSWRSYAAPLGPTKYISLNESNAAATLSGFWNDTAPTATVFTLGSSNLNNSGIPCVAYLFASCPGVSKVGSYTGTGTTQTINCGFTGGARFVMIKATSTTGDWLFWDSARGIVAGNDPYLRINSNAGEVTNTDFVDTAATGFELSNVAGNLANTNGVQYIFLSYS